MRRQSQNQLQTNDQSDEDCTSSASQILERVQPDRVTVTKPEEDRRRRTIIVEKKNGSYGFTLQSYGIHYKKEQEIEMITYVDYVDYDGPAYRAGMREGDVILSINGTDMEKADHKTLVNFIKGCDSRMRMVVLFEDCVRKVELHIRYIQLQRLLQSKMVELEKLCMRERQLLEGKWKTHSLPARKKASHQPSIDSSTIPVPNLYSYYRPALSTEDVARPQKSQNQSLIFSYRYLDPHYNYMLQPTTSSSEYLLSFNGSKTPSEQHLIIKTPMDGQKNKQHKGNQTCSSDIMDKHKKPPTSRLVYSRNLCNPCVQTPNNGDNVSLEAYDLASTCCDPHCVPSTKRRSRHYKDHVRRRDSKTEETQTDHTSPQQQPKGKPHSQASQTSPANQVYASGARRYFHIGAGLVSQCSLHSCTSSELSGVAATTAGENSGSYSTSLSTDTLYWNSSCDMGTSRSQSIKYRKDQRYSQPPINEPVYVQYSAVKPKSWDNLATKAFGGYGFGGYGYIDSKNISKSTINARPNGKSQNAHYSKQNNAQIPQTPHAQRKYFHTNKSVESLLSCPKYSDTNSCQCFDSVSPGLENLESRFFQSPRDNVVSPKDPNFGYYSSAKKGSTASEATRL